MVPNEAYKTQSAHAKKDATHIEHRIAVGMDEATAKARFYLDKLFMFRLPDGTKGFVGATFAGSFNDKHHNINRRGAKRATVDNVTYYGFTDGGLNTTGDADFINGFLSEFANYIRISCKFLSAFYWTSTSYGFEYKLQSDSVWTRVTLGTNLPQAQNANGVKRLVHSGIQPNAAYHFRLWIENNEGFYPSNQLPIVTDVNIIEESFNVRSSSCTETATNLTLLIPSDVRSGMANLSDTSNTYDYIAYTDANFTEAASGWYYSGDDGYSYSYTQGAGFTHRILCQVVPTIKVQLSITVFEDYTYSITANNISGAAFSSSVLITANVSALSNGSIVGSFTASVTLQANTTSSSESGSHTIDGAGTKDYTTGGFSSNNQSVVADSEISGTVGAGI